MRTALNARLSTQFKNVTSVFKTLDDSDQFVMLDGQRLPTASFTMEFQLQVRDPVVEATPSASQIKRIQRRMKLEQEQIKKIGVALGVLAVLLYGYFAYLLDPLQVDESKANAGIASLTPQIADAKDQIGKTADLEKKAPQATAFLSDLKSNIPDGAPIAWFPPKMADFFKSQGIEKCTTRLVSEGDDEIARIQADHLERRCAEG